MKNLMIETEPTTLGVMLGVIYAEYPKLNILQQFAVNNVRVNALQQPFQTVVMYMAYYLPGDAEINQPKILELTKEATKPKTDIKSKLKLE